MDYSAYTKIWLLLPHMPPNQTTTLTSQMRSDESCSRETTITHIQEKICFILSTSVSPFKVLGLQYMKVVPPWGVVLGLLCFGDHNFQFVPLLRFPGANMFVCSVGGNETESPMGGIRFGKLGSRGNLRITPFCKQSKWVTNRCYHSLGLC
jgi:hypothetical protein